MYEDIPKVPEISVAPDPDVVPGLPASFFDKEPMVRQKN